MMEAASEAVSIFTRRRREKAAAEANKRSFTSAKLDLQDWIICDPVLTANAKVVGVYLLACVNSATGQCNPSMQTIADEVSLSLRKVKRAVAELKDACWIAASRHDRRKSNGYVFVENHGRANAIDDRRLMLREARQEERLEVPPMAPRKVFEVPPMAPDEVPPMAPKHLNGTPEAESARERAATSNQYALAKGRG